MSKKYNLTINILIIISMLVLSTIGIISLVSLFSYNHAFNTIIENIESGFKITGLSISAIVFGVIVYGLLISSIILIVISLFIKNKSKTFNLTTLIIISVTLLLTTILSLSYLIAGNEVTTKLIFDITNNTDSNSSTTIAEQLAIIQPVLRSVLTAISSMFSGAIIPCVLGIVLTYNKVDKNFENAKESDIE